MTTQELYASMLLRGYHEHFHYAPLRSFRGKDAAYLIICAAVFVLLRLFPVTQMLGMAFL